MKCYTCFLRPGGRFDSCQGISVVRSPIDKKPVVRLGLDRFLSCSCILSLSSDSSAPILHTGGNGLDLLYDAFPVEVDKGLPGHRYVLTFPVRDDKNVALVRFAFGAQAPKEQRMEVFPSEGNPVPIAMAICAMDRKPWPSMAVDGMWVVGIDDVFELTNSKYRLRAVLKEEGMTEL